MFEPLDLIQSSSRLDYRGLLLAIREHGERSFATGFRHPLLVGAGVLDGDVEDATDPGATAVFQVEDVQEARRDSLQRAIFALMRRPGSDSPPNCFVLGRSPKADIVLADHPISRAHARIRVEKGHYFITDLGATNPTLLNGQVIDSDQEYPLSLNDEISISRYCFRLMDAASLYQLLQGRSTGKAG